MFLMKLLDSFADAAVLLMFNITPNNSGSDDERDADESSTDNSAHTPDPGHVNHVERQTVYVVAPLPNSSRSSSNSNYVITASSMTPTPSADGSSFIQLMEEDMQFTQDERSSSNEEANRRESLT